MFRIYLVCNIEQNMDEDLLGKIADSVGCRNEIYEFNVDLNDNEWTVNFDSNIFGRFKVLVTLTLIRYAFFSLCFRFQNSNWSM